MKSARRPFVSAIGSRRQRTGAFSLVEIVVVLGIIAILAALAAPAVVSLLRSSQMDKAVSMISDELNFARQTALTQNHDVEVRFYLLGSHTNPSDLKYRAFRLFSATSNATEVPLTGMLYFPEPVIISGDNDSSGSIVSTLLDYSNSNLSGLATGQDTLPSGVSASYVSFKFRATGGTNLTPVTSNWYLTLFLENAPKDPKIGIPDNYFTAQIDPVTGRLRSYRP